MLRCACTLATIATAGLYALGSSRLFELDVQCGPTWFGIRATAGILQAHVGPTAPESSGGDANTQPPVAAISVTEGEDIEGTWPQWEWEWWWSFDEGYIRFPIWALIVAFGVPGVLLWRSRFRERRAIKHGACATCGYSLTGLAAGTPCPECGRTSPPKATRKHRWHSRIRWLCTAAAVASAGSYALNLWWTPFSVWSPMFVRFEEGGVKVEHSQPFSGVWCCVGHAPTDAVYKWWFHADTDEWGSRVFVPSWALLIGFGVPAISLWRTHLRRRPSGAPALTLLQ